MVNQTIHELLTKATEKEYFEPILEEQHERALEFLRILQIAERTFSSTSGYFNRKESALTPSLEWMVGQSVLRVKVLLVTEISEIGEFDKNRKWKNLGLDGLRNADPLARVIKEAFTELSYNIDLDVDLVSKFIDQIQPPFQLLRSLPFYWTYIKPLDADKGFLRVVVFGSGKQVVMPDTNVKKIITSYLRFYKNEFPKPHGSGKNSIAL